LESKSASWWNTLPAVLTPARPSRALSALEREESLFHRQGIAREFDCLGSFKRRLAWRQGELIANQQLYQEIGGRT
jgi:hypothetical protein